MSHHHSVRKLFTSQQWYMIGFLVLAAFSLWTNLRGYQKTSVRDEVLELEASHLSKSNIPAVQAKTVPTPTSMTVQSLQANTPSTADINGGNQRMSHSTGTTVSAASTTYGARSVTIELIAEITTPLSVTNASTPPSSTATPWWIPFVNTTARTFPRHTATFIGTSIDATTSTIGNTPTQAYPWCKTLGSDQHYNKDSYNANTNTKEYSIPELPLSGLLYVKSYKASSSTCEGINERIAHRVAARRWAAVNDGDRGNNNTTRIPPPAHSLVPVCPHENRHEFGNSKLHGAKRTMPPESILWTMVREPSSRDLSQIFHLRVSRMNMQPTDKNLLRILQEPRLRGTQARYLMPQKLHESQVMPSMVRNHPKHVARCIKRDILNHYDFIGVTERMTESLAVMTLLWNLHPTDVSVLSAKRAGGYDAGGKSHKCTKIQSATRSEAVQAYLESYEKYQADHADFLLYHAVQESLDRTIDALGKDQVARRVQEIERWQLLIESKCMATTILPCSSSGVYQPEAAENCYIQDAGCGYPCFDRVIEEEMAAAP